MGRLAVFRIGSLSEWRTVSAQADGERVECTFTLNAGERKPFHVKERVVPKRTPTGTSITVFNILDKDPPTPARVAAEMTAQFCAFLLGNTKRHVRVNGDVVDVDALVSKRTEEMIQRSRTIPARVRLQHVLLRRAVDESRFPQQVLFTAKGRTITGTQPPEELLNNYIALAESRYFETIVSANREAIIEMDVGFAQIRDAVIDRATAYGEQYRKSERKRFIENARREEFYPYRIEKMETADDPVATVKQAVYDVLLEKLNEAVNIEGMSKRQRAAVFVLLRRAFENENFLTVIEEVASLSDEDVEKFRQLLERTTLESIIKMSSEVAHRLTFLQVLHRLVYTDVAKYVKERKQLHKIIEPHGWLFGPQFHLATSDRSFREIIRRHRELAQLPPSTDEAILAVSGVENIPDLFLAASRDAAVKPKNWHLLVELKAPTVKIGQKEIEQARRYGRTIRNSSEFDKLSTHFDIYLVSSEIDSAFEDERQKENAPEGCIDMFPNMRIWMFTWAELIARAQEEMRLVREHLRDKSTELGVSQYLRENFPDILESLVADGAPVDDDAAES